MKILIAEDEPHIVTALEFLLGQQGYEVAVARNGEEALSFVAADPPDLVLLDVMMLVRSGYDICREIRARAELSAVKIIMLSAKGSAADVARGLEAGADRYVTKPFSNAELVASIRQLLAARG